jgi:hypothetical protein
MAPARTRNLKEAARLHAGGLQWSGSIDPPAVAQARASREADLKTATSVFRIAPSNSIQLR